MLFATLVLVSVDGEHDGLQKGIDFGHRDKSAKVSNMTGFGLEKEEQVSIFLSLIIVRKETFLRIRGVI